MSLSIVKKIPITSFFIIFYILITLVIFPFGEFTFGDDFYFKLQIDSFINNDFKKSALIDPIFIGQGVIGYFWSLFFGSSFDSLRVLSILATIVFIIFLNKVFDILNFNNYQKVIGNIINIFNPYIWIFSYTFNTEIYFLALSLISIYFSLKYFQNLNSTDLNYLILFSIFSFSVRQYGAIFLLLATYIIIRKNKINIKNILKIIIGFISCLLLILYPKYQNLEHFESISPISIINLNGLTERILSIYEFIPYLGIFTFILLPWAILRLQKNDIIKTLIFTSLLSFLIFNLNIFSLGNVLYIEGIGAKSFTEIEFSITNNILIKYITSFILAFSLVVTTQVFYKFRTENNKYEEILFIILFLSFTFASISTKVFDRYYILFFMVFNLIYLNKFKIIKLNFLNYLFIFFFISINFLFVQEAFTNLKIKWKMAEEVIKNNISTEKSLFLSINYTKFYTYKEKNLTGLNNKYNLSDFNCYVQNYTKGDLNKIGELIKKTDAFLIRNLNIKNPAIEEFGYTKSLKGKRERNSILIQEIALFNPFYNSIGIEMGIRSFCNIN